METQALLMVAAYVVIFMVFYKKINTFMILISLGIGSLLYGLEMSTLISVGAAALTLGLLAGLTKSPEEGFNTRTPAPEISSKVRKIKSDYMNSSMIEGYEDVKKEKDEKPAPALGLGKDEMPTPFKLGEIPSQVKNGPHIDAASTLVKAINSLNPDQINAMSKDTQHLIETQKSLMGMLGSMKPMLNDGKELMDTFQQMFGK
jgi:hypothetical protein